MSRSNFLIDVPVRKIIHEQYLEGEIERWNWHGCQADIVTGIDEKGSWATLYLMVSSDPGKGNATQLLSYLKTFYEQDGYRFGGSVALNPAMRRVYEKCGVHEYMDEWEGLISERTKS